MPSPWVLFVTKALLPVYSKSRYLGEVFHRPPQVKRLGASETETGAHTSTAECALKRNIIVTPTLSKLSCAEHSAIVFGF